MANVTSKTQEKKDKSNDGKEFLIVGLSLAAFPIGIAIIGLVELIISR